MYAKSWVFEGTAEDEYHPIDDTSSISICSNSPSHSNAPNSQKHNRTRRISRASDATSERFNTQMSSFSRCATPSPVPRSGQITPTNGPYLDYLEPSFASAIHNQANHHKQNLLTVDYVTTPTSSVSVVLRHNQLHSAQINGTSSVSSQQDDSQYASLLAELEQSLIDKKMQTEVRSPDDTSLSASTDKYSSSKSSSKDLEFSKELEAALQLIQELETPSEGPLDNSGQATKFARSESEKTLSAAVSLPSPESVPFSLKSPDALTPQNGKQSMRNVIRIEPNSESTSGYSSPNSFSSNAQSSHGGKEQIFTGDQSNIVRIYIEPNGKCHSTNSNSLLTKGHILNAGNLIDASSLRKPLDSLNKSHLLFKKRSKLMPQPEFQNRIFKSECLAYLTDEELVARHRCNRDVIRVSVSHKFHIKRSKF